ncbi:unnamed protein product, partial [Ceratitis capitata]
MNELHTAHNDDTKRTKDKFQYKPPTMKLYVLPKFRYHPRLRVPSAYIVYNLSKAYAQLK